MEVAFRADASETIGTGHLMRCLTLADELRRKGADAEFISRNLPDHLIEIVKSRGHRFRPIAASQPDSDVLHHLAGKPCDWLVVDHYGLGADWERSVRPFAKAIMVIDDLADRTHDCDILLDQNFRTSHDNRYAGLVPESCLLRTGPSFALLQRDYARLHTELKPRETAERLLIYFGGADRDDLTGTSLRAALSLEIPRLQIDVVLSSGSPNTEAVLDLARGHDNVDCHGNLPSLAPLIASADIAIGAMGATSWERLCLGLPTIGVTLAENQVEIASALHRQQLVVWLGDKADVNEAALADCLRQTIDRSDLADWSRRCMQVCDGQGTDRIVSDLISWPTVMRPETDPDRLEHKD